MSNLDGWSVAASPKCACRKLELGRWIADSARQICAVGLVRSYRPRLLVSIVDDTMRLYEFMRTSFRQRSEHSPVMNKLSLVHKNALKLEQIF